jgi:hypothetical protein
MLTNQIQYHVKKIIYHNQVGFISDVQYMEIKKYSITPETETTTGKHLKEALNSNC